MIPNTDPSNQQVAPCATASPPGPLAHMAASEYAVLQKLGLGSRRSIGKMRPIEAGLS